MMNTKFGRSAPTQESTAIAKKVRKIKNGRITKDSKRTRPLVGFRSLLFVMFNTLNHFTLCSPLNGDSGQFFRGDVSKLVFPVTSTFGLSPIPPRPTFFLKLFPRIFHLFFVHIFMLIYNIPQLMQKRFRSIPILKIFFPTAMRACNRIGSRPPKSLPSVASVSVR